LDAPAALSVGLIDKTIVQAVGAALPELEAVGNESVSAPEGRAGNVLSGKPLFDFGVAFLKRTPIRQRFALA
jgi:hypothetical protein